MATPLLYAHRGISAHAPENTLAAFREAHRQGVGRIELDVDILCDGAIAVIHDSTLERTTNATGTFYPLTRQQFKEFDAGAWFSPQYAGEHPPLLEEVLELAVDLGLGLNIELKSGIDGGETARRLIHAVAEILGELPPEHDLIVSSFNYIQLAMIKQLRPSITTAALFEPGELRQDWRTIVELAGCQWVNAADEGLQESQVAKILESGYKVGVWTVNSPSRASELSSWGVNALISDFPNPMLTWARNHGLIPPAPLN